MIEGSAGSSTADTSSLRTTSTATIGPSPESAIASIGRLFSTPPSTSRRPLRESGGTSPGIDMLAPTASVRLPRRWTTSLLESRSALTVKSGFASSSIVSSPNRRSNIRAALRERIRATRGSV